MNNFKGKRVMIGLSGGINSMAVLCWLASLPAAQKPQELHLYYAHFIEHSPDTRAFVEAGFAYAKKNFTNVVCTVTENSAIEFFEDTNYIPHPKYSPCSIELKILPMLKYSYKNCIDVDLIGFIRTEQKRIQRMQSKTQADLFFTKQFPLADRDTEWCFEIVHREIGWFPEIYRIRDQHGKRVFTHNNCLPCKNMTARQLSNVETYYPAFAEQAKKLEDKLGLYFGRQKHVRQCQVCEFD